MKLTPFQEKATEFKLVKKKSCGNKTASKFWKFYHVYDSTKKWTNIYYYAITISPWGK
jgi:hypothetical protein